MCSPTRLQSWKGGHSTNRKTPAPAVWSTFSRVCLPLPRPGAAVPYLAAKRRLRHFLWHKACIAALGGYREASFVPDQTTHVWLSGSVCWVVYVQVRQLSKHSHDRPVSARPMIRKETRAPPGSFADPVARVLARVPSSTFGLLRLTCFTFGRLARPAISKHSRTRTFQWSIWCQAS